MSNKKCTIIEIVADYIYFVMMGTHTEIEQYCKLLSKKTNNYSNDPEINVINCVICVFIIIFFIFNNFRFYRI